MRMRSRLLRLSSLPRAAFMSGLVAMVLAGGAFATDARAECSREMLRKLAGLPVVWAFT